MIGVPRGDLQRAAGDAGVEAGEGGRGGGRDAEDAVVAAGAEGHQEITLPVMGDLPAEEPEAAGFLVLGAFRLGDAFLGFFVEQGDDGGRLAGRGPLDQLHVRRRAAA